MLKLLIISGLTEKTGGLEEFCKILGFWHCMSHNFHAAVLRTTIECNGSFAYIYDLGELNLSFGTSKRIVWLT